MKLSKSQARKRIQLRIRKKVSGTAQKPRLSVFKSNKGMYCQLVDDVSALTLAAASFKDGAIKAGMSKTDQAKEVGKIIAEKAKSQNISEVIFDRSGNIYHGRIKAIADGAREAGLNF